MRERARFFGGTLAVVDIALTLLALYLADVLRHTLPIGAGDASLLSWLSAREYVVVGIVWAFFFRMFHLYDHRRLLRVVDEIRALIPAILFATIVLFAAFFVLKVEFLSRLLFLYFIALDALLLINLRWLLNLVVRNRRISGRGATRVLVVGAGPVGERVAAMIRERPWSGYQVVGFADDDPRKLGERIHDAQVLGGCDELADLIERYEVDDVLIALPMHAYERMREIVVALDAAPVRVRLVPDVFHLMAGRAMAEDVWGLPLISVRAPVITGFDRFVKRVFDLVLAGVSLVLMAPVLAVLALAVYLDGGRPVVFSQRRVGETGRMFTMYKLRTMVPDAESRQEAALQGGAAVNAVYKPLNDPRVTRVGRFLRRTSLDELPQLWNVLRGEMSLVGPRPELPWVVDRYESWQRQRLAVLPGITGWWQVSGRGELPLHENVEYDLYYIQNYSPLLDLTILLRTLWVVARGRGAY